MIQRQAENVDIKPGKAYGQENITTLKYGPDLIHQLRLLADRQMTFYAVLIDSVNSGFLFTTELLLDCVRLAKRLLEPKGVLLFVTVQKAIGFQGDSLLGHQSFLIFETHAELFEYFPPVARAVQVLLGKTYGGEEVSTDLASDVLMSVVPVLTKNGILMKGKIDSRSRRNIVLASIDNFTSLNTLNERFAEQGRMTREEFIEELKAMEAERLIYPIFPKVPMLVNCLRNRSPFSLPDYLVAAKLVSREQVDQLQAEVRNQLSEERITLGPLAMKRGFMNARQLEVILQDQAFYGSDAERDRFKKFKSASEQSQVQSLLGHLGTVDPSNLLQNLAQNRESGVLSVEYKDLQFRALFETGKLSHAKLSKINGNQAVVEFACSWNEGTFVFMKRTPPPDLARDACKLDRLLDKLLLDAALAKDNMTVQLKKLPKGLDTVLEKQEDTKELFQTREFDHPHDEGKLGEDDVALMERVWQALDGLSPLSTVIKRLADVPTHRVTLAAVTLLNYELVTLPEFDVTAPLDKFNRMVRKVAEKLGVERTIAFLRLGMRDTVGYSVRARVFAVGAAGEVGIDMAAARDTGASLSLVTQDIENWQVKFIEYVSQELDSDMLVGIIEEIHQPVPQEQPENPQ
jgi:hypothetical protein